MIASTVSLTHLSDFPHAPFPFLVCQRLKTAGAASGNRVERVLLIWIVDRPVRAFLNSPGCGFSPTSGNIYMWGKSGEFSRTTRYTHRTRIKRTTCARRLFDHVRTQETYDDFGKFPMNRASRKESRSLEKSDNNSRTDCSSVYY